MTAARPSWYANAAPSLTVYRSTGPEAHLLHRIAVAGVAALLAAVFGSTPALGSATTFTYQGHLEAGGSPASGLHDFRFRLFDSATAGTQVGPTVCAENLDVVDGVFTASLDFGQQYATQDPRFLEVQVRDDAGLGCSSSDGFTTLDPRQEVTATPRASHAEAAFTLDAADGSPASAVYVDDTGEVGIGTSNPSAQVHVKSNGNNVILEGMATGDASSAYLSFADATSVPHGWVGDGSSSNSDVYLASYHNDVVLLTEVGEAVTVKPSGRVGIGTGSPQSTLEVRGTVRIGPSGDHFATGGFENLRVVRGTISSSGGISYGSGFTCVRTAAGDYTITFSTAFFDWATTTISTMFSGTSGIVFQGGPGFARVRTYNSAGVLSDTGFNFISVGIR